MNFREVEALTWNVSPVDAEADSARVVVGVNPDGERRVAPFYADLKLHQKLDGRAGNAAA